MRRGPTEYACAVLAGDDRNLVMQDGSHMRVRWCIDKTDRKTTEKKLHMSRPSQEIETASQHIRFRLQQHSISEINSTKAHLTHRAPKASTVYENLSGSNPR
jgi:hypothetical protein